MVRVSKVVFLGTSSAVPVPGVRNTSSVAVVLDSGNTILLDVGEATQHQIMRLNGEVKMQRISAILLTHLHGDHCFGIFGLLCTMGMQGRTDPVQCTRPTPSIVYGRFALLCSALLCSVLL
jgi:ribonuclease Z